MAVYWVGTTGYEHDGWTESFYPAGLSEQRRLAVYGGSFSTVEITSTFHKVPGARALHAWARQVPERFAFSLKAPRLITHDLRLLDAADVVADFVETAGTLGDRLGAILFQVPTYLRCDVARLEDFLHQIPEDIRVAFEFRHRSWFNDEVFGTLQRFDAALCVADREQDTTPFEVTASHGYFRLRRKDYSPADLDRWAERIQEIKSWRDVFIYLKGAHARAPELAAHLRDALAPEPAALPAS